MTFFRLLTVAFLATLFSDPTLMVRACAVGGIHLALLPLYRHAALPPAWAYTGFGLALSAALV
jgi:hypothetical protein